MSKELFCKINQQPCGTDGLGDNGNCGKCFSSKKYLRDIFEMMMRRGAHDYWQRDEGETLIAGYTRGESNVIMRITNGEPGEGE